MRPGSAPEQITDPAGCEPRVDVDPTRYRTRWCALNDTPIWPAPVTVSSGCGASTAYLQDNLEEESLTDDDYTLDPLTLAYLKVNGLSAEGAALLEQALGDREEVEQAQRKADAGFLGGFPFSAASSAALPVSCPAR